VVDLIGDDSSTPTAPSAVSTGPSTQDLLADIFGSSDVDTGASSSAATNGQASRSASADIMSLFGGGAATSTPAQTSFSPSPSANSASGSLMDLMSGPSSTTPQPASNPTPVPQSQPAQPRAQLQSYTAYEKNGLKITLTPKVSPTQAGAVQILARFTATEAVGSVNFQVAVPKVSLVNLVRVLILICFSDTTATNAGHVKFGHCGGCNGNTADENYGASRGESQALTQHFTEY
jgi:AP-1 complex subunit gamma-1